MMEILGFTWVLVLTRSGRKRSPANRKTYSPWLPGSFWIVHSSEKRLLINTSCLLRDEYSRQKASLCLASSFVKRILFAARHFLRCIRCMARFKVFSETALEIPSDGRGQAKQRSLQVA